jgi:hypothetical protein
MIERTFMRTRAWPVASINWPEVAVGQGRSARSLFQSPGEQRQDQREGQGHGSGDALAIDALRTSDRAGEDCRAADGGCGGDTGHDERGVGQRLLRST